ncbi:MAG TPA: methyltransferase domain-containing protein [Ktedonosporobacter sp.]|nr:methyltransferase domain-containing protein [Ktedonosporobacter sp.]
MIQESRDLFLTGKYHKRFEANHIHFLRNVQLRASYQTSSSLIHTLGWPHPLLKQAPQILLCGTASPYTTIVFTRFVRKHNLEAHIDALDLSPYPLDQSKRLCATCPDIDLARVSFVEGDALQMPFPDQHFDWIETDFFIQFFSAAEKVALFKEWYRVLKPGGIITTRDWLQRKQGFTERVVNQVKNWLVLHTLGPVVYTASVQEIEDILRAPGFEVTLLPATMPIIKRKLPLMHHIFIYKPVRE